MGDLNNAHPHVEFPYSAWTRVEDGLPETNGDNLEYWVQDDDDSMWNSMTWYAEWDRDGGGFLNEDDGCNIGIKHVIAWAPYHEPMTPRWE